MAGIGYYNIDQIPKILQEEQIICMAYVIGIFKQQTFISFIISDTTSSAQASLFQSRNQYSKQSSNLPNIGDTIEILGTCSTKPFLFEKTKLFLKIKIERFRVIQSFEKQLIILNRINLSRKKRIERQLIEESKVVRKKVIVKDKKFNDKEMVDIRSLILSYMYIVLSNNQDINSYLFNPMSVVNHRISQEYAKDKEIPQKSLEEAIRRGLKHLKDIEIIQSKESNPVNKSDNNNNSTQNNNNITQIKSINNSNTTSSFGSSSSRSTNNTVNNTSSVSSFTLSPPNLQNQKYIIKKKYFQRLIVEIQLFIFQREMNGVTLEQVTSYLNEKMGKSDEEQFIFNSKFVQKLLMDLINQGRLYKTSDKRLFPSNR